MRVTVLVLAAMLAAGPAKAAEDDLKRLSGQPLVELLRGGGHVVYVRHGAADRGTDDDPLGLGPCTAQRNLSPSGRAEATAIGAAFHRLALPVARVLASPYCRALETAQLAFGGAEVRHELRLWQGKLPDEMKNTLPEQAKRLLAEAPPSGANTVVVAHNYKDLLGFDLQQGEAAVLRPDGTGGFVALARVLPAEWTAHLVAAPELLVASFSLPAGARPDLLAADGQGGIWLAGRGQPRLWHLDGRTGRVRDVGLGPDSAVRALASGKDGAAWLIDHEARQLLRLERSDLAMRRIALPAGPLPTALALDAAGSLWLANGRTLLRMDPATAWLETVGEVRPGAGGVQLAALRLGVVVGGDQGLWWLDGNKLRPLPGPEIGLLRPAADGKVYWRAADGAIGRLEAAGKLVVLSPPTAARAADLAVDLAGRVWLSGNGGLSWLGPHGGAERYELGRFAGDAGALAAGDDGALWLVQPAEGRLLRLLPPVP